MGIDLKYPTAQEKPFPFDYLSRFSDPTYTYESLIADLGSKSYDEDIYTVGERIYPRGPTTGRSRELNSEQIGLLRFLTHYLFDQLENKFFTVADKAGWREVYTLGFQKDGGHKGDGQDIVRIYLNPRTDKEALKVFIDQLIGLLKNPQTPPFSGKFFPQEFFADFNNRFVLYADRTDEGLTNFFRALQGNQTLLDTLEEDGGWLLGQRIPLTKGVSFVEGSAFSWDTIDLDEIICQTKLTREALIGIGRHPSMFQLRLRNK